MGDPSQGTTTLKTSAMLPSVAQSPFRTWRNGLLPDFLRITRDVISEDTGIGSIRQVRVSYRVLLSFPFWDKFKHIVSDRDPPETNPKRII